MSSFQHLPWTTRRLAQPGLVDRSIRPGRCFVGKTPQVLALYEDLLEAYTIKVLTVLARYIGRDLCVLPSFYRRVLQ